MVVRSVRQRRRGLPVMSAVHLTPSQVLMSEAVADAADLAAYEGFIKGSEVRTPCHTLPALDHL